jgi:hypothetical protein
MDDTLRPSGAGFGQFVSHPASPFATTRTTGHCRPVKVTRGVERNSFVRLTAIRTSGETVENAMHPATADRRQLPDGATPKFATQNGRPIEISRGVNLHIRVGVFTVIVTGQTIDHLGRARFHPTVAKRDQQENGRAPNQAEEPPPLPNDRTRQAKIFTVRRSHDPPLAENSREEHKKTVLQ